MPLGGAMVTGDCFCVAAGKPIVVRSDKIIIRIMEFDHRIAQRIGNAELASEKARHRTTNCAGEFAKSAANYLKKNF